jgi:hypothetical protein
MSLRALFAFVVVVALAASPAWAAKKNKKHVKKRPTSTRARAAVRRQ